MRKFIANFYFTYIKRNNIFKQYKSLTESQFWPLDKLEALQIEKLNALWTHAIENVPYYGKISGEIGLGKNGLVSLSELSKIPLLTKDIIRKEKENFYAGNIDKSRFVKDSTSGSSGSNFFFFNDANKRPLYEALEIRKYDFMGVSKFDRELVIWGSSFDIKKSKDRRFGELKNWIKNKKIISGYNLSDEGIENIYKTLISFNPKIIKSYPSILMTVCEYFNKTGYKFEAKAVHIGGEKLYDFQRKLIEETFNCPVYDYYAARDMKQVACNCTEKNGLHVFMENVIFEVVDENGNPMEEGEGDIVLTDLHNYAMPFIRYKIGDRAKISKNRKCKCGRNLQIIDEIIGRTFEIIEFPNGNRVGGTFWTLILKSIPGIKDFQVIKKESNKILIKYTSETPGSIKNFKELINNIHKFSGNDLILEFNEVDNIPVTKAGKMQFVISEIK
jgi:phenylacetate-CoA ligase